MRPVRGANHRKLYGAKVFQNICQAMARDVLRDAWVALDKAGYRVLWTVHDEMIIELPEATAESMIPEIRRIMTTSSPWADGFPLDIEYKLVHRYCK